MAVWIISTFYLLSIVSTLIALATVLSGNAGLTPAQQQYFASLGPLDYLGNSLALLISAWAAIEFFLLRRAAVRAFVVALIMNLGLTAFHLLATNWREAAGGSGVATVMLSWIISAAVLLYARKLERDGILT